MTHPLMSATPLKKIMPTAIAPHARASSHDRVSEPPATSSSRAPRAHRTKPAAIATWIGPHHGVFWRTEGLSSNPPAGTGWNSSPSATSTVARAST